jgi:hypothetical protein
VATDSSIALKLPAESPFYGGPSAADRAKALADLFERPKTFTKEMQELAKHAKRKNMAFAAVIVPENGKPRFAGVNEAKYTNVGSIAKLALLYAAVQLRADVGVIGTTPGLGDEGSRADRRSAMITAVRKAFEASPDAGLRNIGASARTLPRLTRIFDLDDFLTAPSASRSANNLSFTGTISVAKDSSLENVPFSKVPNPSIDDLPFETRLVMAMRAHGDTPLNLAATSCICDVGLPYVQALLTRTGFRQLHGERPGLWLASLFGAAPRRRSDEEQPITETGPQLACDLADPCRIGNGSTGQGATAQGVATFLTLLHQNHLVSLAGSAAMRSYLVRGGRIKTGLRGVGEDGLVLSKVGVLEPWYSDAALITATSISRALSDSEDGGTGSGSEVTWVGVTLLAKGTEQSATETIADLARGMEATVARELKAK